MTDIALDEKALEAATEIHRRASPRYGAEEASRMIAARVIRAYLRASPSQAAPANPAQVMDALSDRVWRALVLDDPTNITITKDELGAALTAAIGAGGQAVAVKPLEEATDDLAMLYNQVLAASIPDSYKASLTDRIKPIHDKLRSALSQPHSADERVAPTDGVSNKAEEGRLAYKAGQSKGSNPYPQGSARYWQWSSGWLDEQAFRPRPDERVVEQEQANAAEAENARLRALPLKDEVERADFWAVQSKTGMHIGLWSDRTDADEAMRQYEGGTIMPLFKSSLLSRLRAGGHEGWRSRAADDVIAERRRQVEVEDWSPEHDDGHYNGELAAAASCYAYSNASVRKLVPSRWATGRSIDDDDIPVGRTDVPANWPDWDGDWWKPSDPRRNLIKAGALIIAEIERLDRSASPSVSEGGSRNG